jgi:hypothetical protein
MTLTVENEERGTLPQLLAKVECLPTFNGICRLVFAEIWHFSGPQAATSLPELSHPSDRAPLHWH